MKRSLVSVFSVFLSTPSARRATGLIRRGVQLGVISIHALREEGDAASGLRQSALWYFYPRPPRGGRLAMSVGFIPARIFLSTPSARRATACNVVQIQLDKISIHALREEGDLLSMGIVPGMCLFLSTPSARRATPSR